MQTPSLSVTRRQALEVLGSGLLTSILAGCEQNKPPLADGLRFAVASDGHLGEPNTPSDRYFTDLIAALQKQHQATPLQFVVINGDLVHQDSAALLPKAKMYLDQLPVPYYVTRGNHDRVSVDTWQSVWGYSTNHVVEHKQVTLVLLDTSNEAGDYLCGDSQWLDAAMKSARTDRPVFLFMHIPYIHNATATDVCGDVVTVLNRYPAVRAVFYGHDHNKDFGVVAGSIALLFDAHFGSSWGTLYRGYRVVEQLTMDTFHTYQYDYINQTRINELSF